MPNDLNKPDVFEVLFEAAPDAVILVNEQGLIENANTQAESLFGYSQAELVGKSIEILLPAPMRDIHVKHRRDFHAKPTKRKMGSNLELHGCTKAGNEFPIDISLSPIVHQGKTMVAAAVRDFTAQRAIEAAMREAKEQAQASTSSKSKFLAAASHDLRQPLQSLSLYLAVLKRQSVDDAAQATIAKMETSLTAMGDLLNALLDLSKLDGSTIEPNLSDFPVQQLLDQLRNDNALVAARKSIELKVEDCSAIITSDPGLLQRIAENFVDNAIKYTDAGSVLIRCRQTEGNLRIQVTDTGIGIPPSQIAAVFDEYVQLNNAVRDRRKGLGLGLTITKNIARLLDHRIGAESSLGKGSTFFVEVPLCELAIIPSPPSPKTLSESDKESLTILLVEDDADVLDATRLLLTTEGHHVASAVNAEDALKLVGKGLRPELIISDYRLPGTDGLACIQQIRQHFGSSLPAILMTGDTNIPELPSDSIPECTILYKPIDADELLSIVSQC